MNTSEKFKDYNVVQKVGSLFIIIAGAITMAKIFNLFDANHVVVEDVPRYIFLIGSLLVLLPVFLRKRNGKGTRNGASLFLVALCTGLSSTAQDYTQQIAAFKQGFTEKSVAPMKEYVSPELKFDPIPVSNTPAILQNIVTNLPKLNAMSILEASEGKAKVKYDFVGLGVRESYIHFDDEGRFVRIELIENLIQQEIEAQKRMKESVQLPSPGALGEKYQPEKIGFKAEDGLMVNGNLYEIGKEQPVILLCHQAGYNRLEYADIAPKLIEMGYNCLAIDQRSGGDFAGKPNDTADRARENDFQSEMIDARADIQAAIDFLYKKYNQEVILWGSSYSSSLALLEGVSNGSVKAMIAFSPGDYFGDAAPSLKTAFAKTDKPFLVTSSGSEAEALTALIGDAKLHDMQIQFIPESEGFHGSRALWTGQEGADAYWGAVTAFLNSIK